jgi:hypothetical protein
MSGRGTSHLLPTYARVDLAFERGEGAWLIAVNGERYLDFTSGAAPNALGHAHPHLVAAISEQATKLWHVSNLYRIPEAERLPASQSSFADVVFCQFRGRGDGMRHQDGAKISVGERQAGAPASLRSKAFPWPHIGDAGAGGQKKYLTALP